jgi:hypothetical protein
MTLLNPVKYLCTEQVMLQGMRLQNTILKITHEDEIGEGLPG